MANLKSLDPQTYAAARLEITRRTAHQLGFEPTDSLAKSSHTKKDKNTGRDPILLGSIFSDLIETRGWQTQLSVAKLSTIWPEIVGQVAAKHCQVEEFKDNKLKIRAGSTNWAVQLRLLEPTIRKKIEENLGKNIVDEITILGPAPPYVNTGRYSVPGRGWRDTWG